MQQLNHRSRRRLPLPVVLVGLGLLFSAAVSADGADKSDNGLLKEAQGTFKPLPKDMATREFPVTPDRVNLGRVLFFDPRISADGTVSCMRCHQASLYATDGLPKSHGAHDKLLPRNAPTVFNAALQFKAHWRGEFENVEEQAKRSLLGPGMANPDFATAMARVKAIPGYADLFKKAFPGEADPVTADNWGKAVGAYERTLVTPSRFDEYLGGKTGALTAEERQGLRTFIDTGCANCHSGVGIGGGKFRKFGVEEDYWKATGSKEIDKGRIDLTKAPADLYVFKVPGLRNVAMTPPYFHDGSVGTLPDAVRVMARVQLGKRLSDHDTAAIVTFLKSLTGKRPDNFATAPALPPTAFDAPAPHGGKPPEAAAPDASKLSYPIMPNAGGVVPLPRAVEQPRKGAKAVFDITADTEPGKVNKGLEQVARLLNLYGAAGLKAQDVKIAAICHGAADKAVLSDAAYLTRFKVAANPNLPLIRDLKKVGVELFVCGQSLHDLGFKAEEVADEVPVADSAMLVLVNKQADGYAYIPAR